MFNFNFNLNLFKTKRNEVNGTGRKQENQGGNEKLVEFPFSFDEGEGFVNICVEDKGAKTENEYGNAQLGRYCDDLGEVDLSVDEMIQFNKGIKKNDGLRMSLDSSTSFMQKRIEKIRSGIYKRKLDAFTLHQTKYNDVPLEPFEDDPFDDKRSRKAKVCSRRTRDFANKKITY